jgi:signal transduction histidine kinase
MNHSIGPIINFAALAAAFGFQPRNAQLHTRFSPAVVLRYATETMPPDSPGSGPTGSTLGIARHMVEEGRAVIQGSRAPGFAPASLEQELSSFLEDSPTGRVRCEISVTGRRRVLQPEAQEQIKLIAREAIGNALRHSGATLIEVEVEYSVRRLRLIVRDNGCGIDPNAVRAARETHWGLLGMRERAERIGAKLTVWSKAGAGTEVEITGF